MVKFKNFPAQQVVNEDCQASTNGKELKRKTKSVEKVFFSLKSQPIKFVLLPYSGTGVFNHPVDAIDHQVLKPG